MGTVDPAPLVEPHHRLRAEAAVLLAEDNFTQAIDTAKQGLILLESSFNRGDVRVETERLNEIIAQSQDSLQAGKDKN